MKKSLLCVLTCNGGSLYQATAVDKETQGDHNQIVFDSWAAQSKKKQFMWKSQQMVKALGR